MNTYIKELHCAMKMLSGEGYIFVGQALSAGTSMSSSFDDVPDDQKLEFPVAENCQLGFCTGISLAGGKVCSIFPRINFMLEAIPQLVQHLDKIPLFSDFKPKVIIRTAIATDNPLDPGPQHIGDYSNAIQSMLSTVQVRRLKYDFDIMPEYEAALKRDVSTILIEYSERFL